MAKRRAGAPEVFPEFVDFCRLLKERGVRFLVVGAHAVGFHAAPRFTKDLDLFVEATPRSAAGIVAAIEEFFAAPTAPGTAELLSHPGRFVQLGVPPRRIDLLTQLSGIATFEEAWSGGVEATLADEAVVVIGLPDLMRNKAAANRPKDRLDLRALIGQAERRMAAAEGRSRPRSSGSSARKKRGGAQ